MSEAKTPLMKQYWEIKAQFPDAVLLFRVGDFYETFGEDAVHASKALGIVLTRKANGQKTYTQLAGFPHHALDSYLPKLVRAGYKVAVCDQLEDPKQAVKIVKRGVTELVTPGIVFNDQLLEAGENNFLCAAAFAKDGAGLAFLDISTGTFHVTEGDLMLCDSLLSRYNPREILMEKGFEKGFKERFGQKFYISTMEEWAFVEEAARDKLLRHFRTDSLKGFGVAHLPLAVSAAGALLFYLESTRHTALDHICSMQRIDGQTYMWLDRFSIRNLELFPKPEEKGSSLLEVVDRTLSPMGARLLHRWIAMPLVDKEEIVRRHKAVSALVENEAVTAELRRHLQETGDLERLVSKAAAGRLGPKEAVQLKLGLQQVPALQQLCRRLEDAFIGDLGHDLDPCEHLAQKLERELLPEAPNQLGKGPVIAPGVYEELDKMRYIMSHGKEFLQNMQEREAQRTGITSLRVAFNNVFGYYIEVRNTHKDKVPEDWIRKQTLVNAERYITPELKEYEQQILGAEEKIAALEASLYGNIVAEIQGYVREIQQNAHCMAVLDIVAGFAVLARERKYVCPSFTEDSRIDIKQGRHPVIEALLPPGERYVANDVYLDRDRQQVIILTGPNMAGKSALLRQTALVVLLAQIGCFVPAESATMGITDKLFTRVGASDNIARGESTFLVEMLESAAILNNLSDRSLVLLDEIGRGTSTYDGLSIAWAMVEYIHDHPWVKAKTLFATHYHELNRLTETYPRVKNFHIAVKESGQKVIFLRKMEAGGTEHSFGIHVAAMAGMPKEVTQQARRILKRLEAEAPVSGRGDTVDLPVGKVVKKQKDAVQLSFFQLDDPLLAEIRKDLEGLDLNNLTPLQAFDVLRSLRHKLKT